MSLSPLEKATSGAIASVFANALVYPLDLSKTLVQTQILDPSCPTQTTDPHSTQTTDPYSTQTTDPYPTQKDPYSTQTTHPSSPSSAPPQTRVSPTPLKHLNTLDILKQIRKKQGVLGWYHGIFSLLAGVMAQNFAYFYWYAVVQKAYRWLHRRSPRRRPNAATELLLGALAAAISQLFTTPIGVLATHQQTSKDRRTLVQYFCEKVTHSHWTLLWKGLKVSLVLTINPSITYGLAESLKRLVYGNEERLRPHQSFLVGVMAKAMATLVTQPLIVSKALMQRRSDGNTREFPEFTHALHHLWETEKCAGLYKGILPQLTKGVMVQGLLVMSKDQIEYLLGLYPITWKLVQ